MKRGIFFEKCNDGFGGIYLGYEAGGFYEKKGFRGLSHLAEHIKCKKEKTYKREINTLCLETNAITDDKNVIFYCKGLEKNVAEFADSYLNCFDHIPSKEEFENEKLIVVQEVESALDSYTLGIAYERGMLNHGGAIGFIEDIKAISYESFLKFYKDVLGKPSVVVFVGGENLQKAFQKHKTIICHNKLRKYEIKEVNENPDISTYKAWSSKSSLGAILFAKFPTKEKKTTLNFFAGLLGDGFYSPLYQIIREKHNLVYYFWFSFRKHKNSSIFEAMTETSELEKVKTVFFEILNNFETYVTEQDYKDYLKKKSIQIQQAKMKKNTFSYIQIAYFNDGDCLYEEFDPLKPEFSYDKMKKIAKTISDRNNWKAMTHFKNKILFFNKV